MLYVVRRDATKTKRDRSLSKRPLLSHIHIYTIIAVNILRTHMCVSPSFGGRESRIRTHRTRVVCSTNDFAIRLAARARRIDWIDDEMMV